MNEKQLRDVVFDLIEKVEDLNLRVENKNVEHKKNVKWTEEEINELKIFYKEGLTVKEVLENFTNPNDRTMGAIKSKYYATRKQLDFENEMKGVRRK